MPPSGSRAVSANFPSDRLTIGAGVAIFHLATSRVVVCYHTRDRYWFLPKGRRNANETTTCAAEREGFEESGYRNRVLPLPMKHRQPVEVENDVDRNDDRDDDGDHDNNNNNSSSNDKTMDASFAVEPFWTQLLPLSETKQYLLFWYAAETVPSEVERELCQREATSPGSKSRKYCSPPPYPRGLALARRMEQDVCQRGLGLDLYEPVRHEGTGVDDEEALYTSRLLPVEEARRKLRGSVMEDVVRRAWEAIELRKEMEMVDRVSK